MQKNTCFQRLKRQTCPLPDDFLASMVASSPSSGPKTVFCCRKTGQCLGVNTADSAAMSCETLKSKLHVQDSQRHCPLLTRNSQPFERVATFRAEKHVTTIPCASASRIRPKHSRPSLTGTKCSPASGLGRVAFEKKKGLEMFRTKTFPKSFHHSLV